MLTKSFILLAINMALASATASGLEQRDQILPPVLPNAGKTDGMLRQNSMPG